MTGRARALVAVVAVAAALAAVTFALGSGRPQLLDLTRDPETVFATVPFQVGETYTLGSIGLPSDAIRPLRITSIEVLETSGLDQIGAGAYDPKTVSQGIGLVPGWPPSGLGVVDPGDSSVPWASEVSIVVGVRTTQPKSGLRGVPIRWVDGAGNPAERVVDVAVLTCAPDACEVDAGAPGALLLELGLKR